MSFDSSIVLWCIAAPAAIAAITAAASRWLPDRLSSVACAVGWWLAILAALVSRQGWQWWSDESWCRAIWPLLAWAVVVAGSRTGLTDDEEQAQDRSPAWRWVAAGVLASLTAWVAMPTGEGWSDTYELQPWWMVVVATSCLLNGFALESLALRRGGRWCLLVALAGLAGPMALAVSTYASLAEWTLSMVAATAAVALLGFLPRFADVWVIAFPISAAAAGIVAAARFYGYEEHSGWAYAAALYGPALVAIIDLPIHRRPNAQRIVTAALVAAALAGFCIWSFLLSGEAY